MNDQNENPEPTAEDIFGPVIYSYSRAQAIEDGVLVDLTAIARLAGFRVPVAMTSALWAETVALPKNAEAHGQSIDARLHDVLFVALCEIRRNRGESRADFKVGVIGDNGCRKVITAYAQAGPGDAGELVITIMLENED